MILPTVKFLFLNRGRSIKLCSNFTSLNANNKKIISAVIPKYNLVLPFSFIASNISVVQDAKSRRPGISKLLFCSSKTGLGRNLMPRKTAIIPIGILIIKIEGHPKCSKIIPQLQDHSYFLYQLQLQ